MTNFLAMNHKKWQPMRSAPKDRHILLAYDSFDVEGKISVCMGKWISLAHEKAYEDARRTGKSMDTRNVPGWRVCYFSTWQHCGHGGCRETFEERCAFIKKPLAWQELPDYTKTMTNKKFL